jgi:hypothetical protein
MTGEGAETAGERTDLQHHIDLVDLRHFIRLPEPCRAAGGREDRVILLRSRDANHTQQRDPQPRHPPSLLASSRDRQHAPGAQHQKSDAQPVSETLEQRSLAELTRILWCWIHVWPRPSTSEKFQPVRTVDVCRAAPTLAAPTIFALQYYVQYSGDTARLARRQSLPRRLGTILVVTAVAVEDNARLV